MKSRAELKEEYKLRKPSLGVFQIRNTSNGKVFVATSTQLDKVWNRHKFQLEFGSHPNKELQRQWNEFGADSFVFEVVEELKPSENEAITPTEELKVLEQLCLERIPAATLY
jgi:hypothetical protein